MPFQFTNNNLSTLIDASSRLNIVDDLKDALLTVGWTIVTTAAGDHTLLSGLTPHGLQCRVRIYDPGSGVTARVKFLNSTGSLSSNDLFLQHSLKAPISELRVLANPYQFFVYYEGGIGLLNKSFICGGVPALYSFDVGIITEAVWCHGDATSDGDTTLRQTFKIRPNAYRNPSSWMLCNGNHWQGSTDSAQGNLAIAAELPGSSTPAGPPGANPTLYYSGESYKVVPDLAWGLTQASDFAYIRGMLWDAAFALDWFPQDALTTFDDHNWRNIMQVWTTLNPNPRETGDQGSPTLCSLWIVEP